MLTFLSTKQFDKTYETLGSFDQERIIEKLKYLKNHTNIFAVIKKVHDLNPATHRLRIGTFRILLKIDSKNKNDITIILLRIGHRKDIYH